MLEVRAADYRDPSGSIVGSGEAVAAVVAQKLAAGEDVLVTFAGLRGLPSSYYNSILRVICDQQGLAAIGTRVRFHFETPAQEFVFKQSLAAFSASTV